MSDTEQRAREALEAQGIRNPGPELTRLVVDAIASEQEGAMPGERTHQCDYAVLLADTSELLDRTTGPMTNPGTETPMPSRTSSTTQSLTSTTTSRFLVAQRRHPATAPGKTAGGYSPKGPANTRAS
jgi:hypothetical protein